MLSTEGCRKRQQRLLRQMEIGGLDLFVSANYRTVYYLTGNLSFAEAPAIVAIQADGRSALVSSVSAPAVADVVLPLETYSIQRVIDQPMGDAVELLRAHLGGIGPVRTCGVERGVHAGTGGTGAARFVGRGSA